MDLTDTIAPTSDQLDAVDLLTGPRTFTIETVSVGNAEQPVNIKLTEFPRVWRPGKSMRRVLVACWGVDASKYAGRRVRLYCDPTVRFGGQEIGGTRISHLSDLDKPRKVPLLVSRGKSEIFVVQPLVETAEDRVAEFKREWKTADPERRKVIKAEVAALTTPESTKGIEPMDPEEPVTQQQMKRVHAQLGNLEVKDDDRHRTFSILLQREIASAKDITAPEMRGLIDLLDDVLRQDDPKAVLASTLEQLSSAEAQGVAP